VRYRVTGLPANAQRGLSAFFPHLNRLAASGAQQYKDGVTGLPGTAAIPVTTEFPQANWPVGQTYAYTGTSTSSDAPNYIYPNQYYVRPERNYRPGLLIQMYDPTAPELTTMIPVPAVSYRQTYHRNAAALAMGLQGTGTDPKGRKQIKQPLSGLIHWPSRSTGNGLPTG
jgi:hypothetical protein